MEVKTKQDRCSIGPARGQRKRRTRIVAERGTKNSEKEMRQKGQASLLAIIKYHWQGAKMMGPRTRPVQEIAAGKTIGCMGVISCIPALTVLESWERESLGVFRLRDGSLHGVLGLRL